MSKQSESSLSSTLVAGSEEDFDVICDPCHTEGQRVNAIGHCLDCNGNLCEACFKVHRKINALKGHEISNTSTLSSSKKAAISANRAAKVNDPLTDPCTKHPEEVIKFYCNSHKSLGCSVCVSIDHRACKDMLYIKDVSGGVANSDELKQIQTDLQLLLARLTSTQHRTNWMKQEVDDSYTQTVTDIRNFKKKIIDAIDKLEKEILERALIEKEVKIVTLNSTICTFDVLIEETRARLTDLEKKKSMSHNNKLFISMKTAQDRLHALADAANHEIHTRDCERLSFKQWETLAKLIPTLTSLGTITSQTGYIKAQYQHDISVKCDTDTDISLITGMIVLPDGRLALTDYNNQSVKLVDVTQRKVSEQITPGFNPLCITHTKEEQIAVTVKGKRYIQVLSVSPALSKCHAIAVPGLYTGIEYSSDKLIVVCKNPIIGLHILDMSGVLLQQIETDNSGNKLFKHPSRIAISPDHGVLHITDRTEKTVVSLTMDGHLISKYSSDSLQEPIRVAVDDDGYVYVCSNHNSTVHRLSPCGQLVKILLEEKDGIKFPSTIAHSAGTLYISSSSKTPALKNNLKVFSLHRKEADGNV